MKETALTRGDRPFRNILGQLRKRIVHRVRVEVRAIRLYRRERRQPHESSYQGDFDPPYMQRDKEENKK